MSHAEFGHLCYAPYSSNWRPPDLSCTGRKPSFLPHSARRVRALVVAPDLHVAGIGDAPLRGFARFRSGGVSSPHSPATRYILDGHPGSTCAIVHGAAANRLCLFPRLFFGAWFDRKNKLRRSVGCAKCE